MEYFNLKPFRTKLHKEVKSKDELPKIINSERKRFVCVEYFPECDPSLAMSHLHLNMNPYTFNLKKLMLRSLSTKKKEKIEWKEKLPNGLELSFSLE